MAKELCIENPGMMRGFEISQFLLGIVTFLKKPAFRQVFLIIFQRSKERGSHFVKRLPWVEILF